MENNKIKQSMIEKLKNIYLDKVSGGYVGQDWWSKEYAPAYKKLGIEHKKNALKYDEYFLEGQKIPKKFAYAAVESYLAEEPTDDQEDLLCDFFDLKNAIHELHLGIAKRSLKSVWDKFG